MKGPTILAALAALAVASMPAAAQGTWCSEDMVSRNCGFYTFEQCMAHARGLAGYCMPNHAAPAVAAGTPPKPGKRARKTR
jgi:hypothetical protein